MKKLFAAMFLILMLWTSAALAAVVSPHTSLTCSDCHIPVVVNGVISYDMTRTSGLDNLCLDCHKPALMNKSFTKQDLANPFGSTNLGTPVAVQKQTSHNWAAPVKVQAAGADTPLNPLLADIMITKTGVISCASCHAQHDTTVNNLGNILRIPNDKDQLCLDCHRVRNQRNVQTGTHPVNFEYAGSTSKVKLTPAAYQPVPVNANPANPTSAMKLPGGLLLCSTCHGVHYSDSNARTFDNASSSTFGKLSSSKGYLLRTDLRGGTANQINICTNCHAGKVAHNRKGQNVQCADCHGGHVDPGDGTAPNVWLVRRYMNYSGGVKLNSYRTKVLNQAVGAQSNFAGKDGVCQACHNVPAPGGAYPVEHASTNPDVCRSCHGHDSASGSFSADCTSCHGMPPQQNVPLGPLGYAKTSQYNYATSGVFKDEAVSGHFHATAPYAYGCNECHAGNNHATGNFQQVFIQKTGIIAALFGATPTYNAAAGTCLTTYCHSNGAPDGGAIVYKTPAWANAKNATLKCAACHDALPATNAHSGHISFGYTCEYCHVATATGSTSIKDIKKHVNGIKEVQFSGTATIGGTGSFNSSTNTCTGLYCHSNGNKNFLVYVNPPAWNSGTKLGCNGCHGTTSTLGAPDYANGGAGATNANSHNAHIAGSSAAVCANCHFTTINSTTGSTLAAHLSGNLDVVFNPAVAGPNASYNSSTKTCANVVCHGNSLAQWGSKGGCLGCHTGSINNRAAITNQFNGNSHHVQGTLISGEHCFQCHWEANSDGSINGSYHRTSGPQVDLVVYGAGTRPTTYTAGTTAIAYTANGTRIEIAKINSHCISCHNDANKTIQPFGDGKTPAAYAWDANSIAAKFGDTGTTPWGKYAGTNVTPKSTVTKAFSAHGNATANKGGWNTTETWPDRLATSNVLCFDCHNSHGSSAAGTTTSYTSATTNGGILKDTEAGKGGYAMSYKPASGGSAAEHNAYNPGAGLCFDCHMKDTAITTPWGYKATFGATQQIMGYWDSAYFGNNTFGYALRYTFKNALSNKGGHFGASSAMSSVPAHQVGGLCTPCHDPHGVSPKLGVNKQLGVPLLKGTWLTSPYKEDVATADNKAYLGKEKSDGPADMTAYKAAITTSYHIDQNTFTSGNITQTIEQSSGLCLNCHAKATLTNGTNHTWKSKDRIHESVKGWKTANTTVKHNFSCSKCHAPHNANLPRLMITNCLDASHRGRVANNVNPVTSGSFRGEGGSGAGHMPGIYDGGEGGRGGWSGWTGWTGSPSSGTTAGLCHDNNDAKQLWNIKTPWITGDPVTPAPTVPVIVAEPDLVCSSGCSATLQWAASTNSNTGAATEYQVQLSTTSAFTTIQASSGWISTLSYTPSVTTGNTYYWRVQARDKTKTTLVSNWSTVDSFVVSSTPPTSSAPSVPVIVAEPDLVCSSGCTATLQWAASTNSNTGAATEYQVQLSTTSAFTTVQASSGWISTLSYTPSVITGNTYYWRVQARDKTQTTLISNWSTVDSFIVSSTPPPAGGAPTVPVIKAEPDLRCSSGCSATLEWAASVNTNAGAATQYQVQVSRSSSFSTIQYSSGWISTLSYRPSISTGYTYYWRVQARDRTKTTLISAWSTVDNFVVSR